MIYKLTDIAWDTDGEDVNLPTEMFVEADNKDSAIDVASDQLGYCISAACVEDPVLN